MIDCVRCMNVYKIAADLHAVISLQLRVYFIVRPRATLLNGTTQPPPRLAASISSVSSAVL
jgi:type II secretory pathway component PulK